MAKVDVAKTKKRGLPPIVYILLGALCIFFITQLWNRIKPSNDRMSIGNHLLIQVDATSNKQQGTEAFANGDYQKAIKCFKDSLLQHPNDPETLIYLNNAQAANQGFKIAVSVPIGSNLNVAQEILRGVAQAQNEINSKSGINGRKLQVEIVNDENDPEIAQKVANQLVKDSQVLAVIGHNASNASVAAAPFYQKGGLVMVSPTSFANNLSGLGNYIFRTVATTKVMAEALAKYTVKTARKTKLAFCYDSQAPDNVSFKDEFLSAFITQGGQLVPTVCDLSVPNFNPNKVVEQSFSSGADGLFVSPHIDRLQAAIDVVKANHGRLALFSSPTIYTIKTLELGQQDVKGLLLPAPWHPQVNPSFAEIMRQRWRGNVSWRTATAYDATQVIIEGLKQNNTRDGLQQVLRSSAFTVRGASDSIRFTPTGDRIAHPVIVQIQPRGAGYDFVMVSTAR